jgi:hypothetical protein
MKLLAIPLSRQKRRQVAVYPAQAGIQLINNSCEAGQINCILTLIFH